MPKLAEIYADLEEDPFWDHLRLPGIKLVRGYGTICPKVLLVGEAPGAQENAKGRPFVGHSGRVLAQLMDSAGLCLDDEAPGDDGQYPGAELGYPANAFITNVVKYRPPGNRTPTLREVDHALPVLREEYRALGGPKVIVCVGGTAHRALHPDAGSSLTSWVNKPVASKGTEFISMFHPAFVLHKRSEHLQKAVERAWEDLGTYLQEGGLL